MGRADRKRKKRETDKTTDHVRTGLGIICREKTLGSAPLRRSPRQVAANAHAPSPRRHAPEQLVRHLAVATAAATAAAGTAGSPAAGGGEVGSWEESEYIPPCRNESAGNNYTAHR